MSLYDPDAIGIRTLSTFVKETENVTINQIYFKNLFPSVYPYSEKEITLLIDKIKELNTELLGISLRSSSWKTAVVLIKKIRETLPQVKIIIGGTHAILSPDECLTIADIVCIGEGEYPFLHLVKSYSKDLTKSTNIQGLWFNLDGHIYKNEINPLIDINDIPVINYSNKNKWYIENDNLTIGDPITGNAVAEVFSSRGCPYHCSFCSNSILKDIMHKGRFVRVRSVDNIIKDIDNVIKYFPNLKKLVFGDEVFAFNKKWTIEFCQKYKEHFDLPFAALFSPRSLKEDSIKMLSEVGLTHGRIGTQSGSETVRIELYGRKEYDHSIINAANIFHKYKVRFTFDTIVNNPYETEEDMRRSLEFYTQIPHPFEMNMHSLVYFPKTELTVKALKDNIITPDQVEGATDDALRLNHVLIKNKKMAYNYPNNLFWNCLFSLTSKSFIPKKLIFFISNRVFLRNNPVYLLYLANLANLINVGFIGIGLLIRNEITFKDVFVALKSFKALISVNK
jgi:radical SAM superfamily enzyme YgiQ (UPF0313 family)